MKTLGQMLMDAYAKADTVDTVALVGDRLVITHKPNANEQIEAAFTEEFKSYVTDRLMQEGFPDMFLNTIHRHVGWIDNHNRQTRRAAYVGTCITLGIPISKDT